MEAGPLRRIVPMPLELAGCRFGKSRRKPAVNDACTVPSSLKTTNHHRACGRRTGRTLPEKDAAETVVCLRRSVLDQTSADRLGLGIILHHFLAHLASPAGLLVAAEGQRGIAPVVGVDPDRAR